MVKKAMRDLLEMMGLTYVHPFFSKIVHNDCTTANRVLKV